MREPGEDKWTNLTEKLDMEWMGEVEEVFRYYTEVRRVAVFLSRRC
jgi:trehalose 6-phosphate synthase/phosphatase